MKKRVLIWGGFIALLIIIILMMVQMVSMDSGIQEENVASENLQTEIPDILQPKPDDRKKGNSNASVVIVKYSDFQCPACRFYASFDDHLSTEMGEDVLFVYRHFPLRSFPYTRLAAQYAEAAGEQGKFWEMHDLIYINQQYWSQGGAEDVFRQFAEMLELDMDQLREDLTLPELNERIQSDYQSGVDLGVNAVPTLFINGRQVRNPNSLDAYRDLIRSYLD